MKALLILPLFLASAAAFADCPRIEGKYSFECRLKKSDDAFFAESLTESGKMLVQQTGCERYDFTNLATGGTEALMLEESFVYDPVKIKTQTAKRLRMKSIFIGDFTLPLEPFFHDVFKISLRKNAAGFKLKGREVTRLLGVRVDRASTFNCAFKRD